jgi:serine-type D-Ala-D-Ala carboxypeptidase (penicillin-binding protein 5/6)
MVAPPAWAEPSVQPASAVDLPQGPAQAWLLADLDNGRILASRNPSEPHAPASTIKALLAMVVLDQLPLTAVITATPTNTDVECSCVGVKEGRAYTVRQLLDGLMLVSGNDAANTLASMLGGRDVAVTKMNGKAALLGAYGTNAGSPSGLDGPGIDMWSSPHDLAVIFRAAMANPVFAQITAQPPAVFPTKTGDRVLVNQDELLKRYPGAIGGKTGFTDIAKKTFVGAADRNGRRLVIALMFGMDKEGAPTYWDQAAGLLDWGFALDRSATIGAL